jgi:amino acid adenylation domain-containing protein
MNDLRGRLAKLSPEQRTLLLRKLAAQKNTLKAVTDRSSLPLSFSQQRLWFLDQFEPGSANYNIPRAYRIRGPLDINALHQAFNEIVHRHESLRTTFAVMGDAPIQHIAPMLELDIPLLEANDETTLHNLIMAEANRPFDLQQGPLLRAKIVRLADANHVLLFNQHHIISDGWSMGIFNRELQQLYAAFAQHKPSPLAKLSLQYADFAAWQQQQGESLAQQIDYWKQKLASIPILELPSDHPRPAVQRYCGAILNQYIATPLTAQLKHLAQQEQATLFMLLMAVFQTLLHRYSNQEDFTIGTPIAGRNHSELEDIIGFFVNTLVLRADLSGSPTLRQLLARVRETSLAAFSHQDVSFEKLVEELLPERDMSRNPLFQVMFVLQNTPHSELTLHGTRAEQIHIPVETEKFDLSLYVMETANGLTCTFSYSTDLFDTATIERMAGHFRKLLQSVVSNPDQRVAELPLLSESEQKQLANWNNTDVDYHNDATIQQLIEQQVYKTPDAIALVFNEHKLSYHELNRRANQLAHHLISMGARPETLVGLCLERSLEMVIAILGVLKVGAAYVPLDPAHPAERLYDILNDAQMPLLLCSNNTATKLADTLAKKIVLDGNWPIIADSADSNPAPYNALSSAAYVIYTSGSTGKPKGVINHQAGICNRLLWMQQTFQLSGNDAVLQKTPYSFDVSVWEFLWPLMTGARLVLAKPDGHKDTAYLAQIIDEQNITIIHFVPSMLQLFLDTPEVKQHCCSLRYVICSGEALSPELVKRYYNRLNTPLHNLYGPTEAAIEVTHWPCSQNTDIGTVPIGKPIANTYIHLLDAQLRPVPIGIAGELHIGGIQLAHGYLNRPKLTAERFIKDPFSDELDARLYKTGDLARYLPDGNIEYLGRIDFQVKLRGYRIELGEIESLLRQHSSVKDAVAIVREDTPGDQRLTAYVIPEDNADNTQALMNMLKAKLPEYMVPTDIVFLETFSLTTSGKIDRKSLPEPAHDRLRLGNEFTAPRSPYEKRIARIWGEIMALENPGLHDNFFELGGHSLLATRVISRINRDFDTQLPLRNLFESPTIAGLAQALLINKTRALQEATLTTRLDQLENLTEAEAEELLAEKTAREKS